jgi:hypothetical protein
MRLDETKGDQVRDDRYWQAFLGETKEAVEQGY